MEDKAYLGKAHSNALAGPYDAETPDMFLGIDPLARCGSVWNDHTHIVPVPQDMDVDADSSGSFPDPQ